MLPREPTRPDPGISEKGPWGHPLGNGLVVIPPGIGREPHRCEPPGQRDSALRQLMGDWIPAESEFEGMLWYCNCGCYWLAKDHWWERVNRWRAWRLTRNYRRQKP